MTDVGTLTLSDFLLARIAEDEAVATNHGALAGDHWAAQEPNPGQVSCDVVGRGRGVVVTALQWEAEHIARHDPARVLAECEAKRQLIQSELEMEGWSRHPEDVLVFLALPYADHPDYREEWRP